MSKIIDLTGRRFGRLLVVEESGRNRWQHFLWKCVCDCGVVVVVRGGDLKSGDTKSCGCLRKEKTKERFAVDLVGKRFGRLVVFRKDEKWHKGGNQYWECLCNCGNVKIIRGNHLRSGAISSCGCLQKEKCRKHGMTETPTYSTWEGMISRCNNPKRQGYKYYGGRGITVCKKWLEFKNFYVDMGEKPKGLTIERIDNDKGYYPENCKWATYIEQTRNKRTRKDNKTGATGISWDKRRQKYLAQIIVNHKHFFIGLFANLEIAITARKKAEQKYWR